jgi:hypothetical protein
MSKEKANKVYDLWRDYADSGSRQKWERIAEESEQFRFGMQWTPKQMAALKDGGMHPAVRNRIGTAAQNKQAMLAGNMPRGRVTFVDGKHEEASYILNGVLKYIYYISDYYNQMNRVSHQVVSSGGVGWGMPIIDNMSSDGLGDIKIRWISNRYVYVSPTVTEIPSLEDAAEVFIAKPVSTSWAKKFKPDGVTHKQLGQAELWYKEYSSGNKDALNETLEIGPEDDLLSTGDEPFATVLKIEKYELLDQQMYMVENARTGQKYEASEDKVKEISKLDRFLNFITLTPTRKVRRLKISHIYAPNVWIGEEWWDIDRYPMVPFISQDTMNLFPRDDVYYARDEQVLLNKAISQGIQATQLSMTPKLFVDETSSPENTEEIQKKWAQTNAVLKLPFSMDGKPPVLVQPPSQMTNPFWVQIPLFESGISYVLGVMPQDLGDPSESPETFAATQQIRNWGMQKNRPVLNSWNTSLQRLIDNTVQLIPQVYNGSRVISFFDDEWEDDLQTMGINVPQYIEGKWQMLNGIRDMRASYRIVWDSFIPKTNREQMVATFGELFKNSGGSMLFFEEMLKYMDVPNRKKIAEKFGLVKQLQQQLAGMQEEMRGLQIDLDRAQREEVNAKQQAELANFRSKHAIDFIKDKEKRKEITAEFRMELEKILDEMRNDLEKKIAVRDAEHDAKLDIIEAKKEAQDG